jgi:hypothetical protein
VNSISNLKSVSQMPNFYVRPSVIFGKYLLNLFIKYELLPFREQSQSPLHRIICECCFANNR